MTKKRILIIGGDSRLRRMGEEMVRDGYIVHQFCDEDTLKGALAECDVVILGLPATLDNLTVDAPTLGTPVLLKDLFALMHKQQLLLGGRLSERCKALADVYGVRWADYFARKEAETLNAVPTVEGAIQLAMEELPITIHGARAIVTGYGRIGKLLSKTLRDLGAQTEVCARKYEDFALIRANNLTARTYRELPDIARHADVIFNTVPAGVIDRTVLAAARHCLVIDLASKPGGTDFDGAKDLGVNVIWALGLPGKVAPLTAGRIIQETVYNIFNELGE